MSNQRYMNVFMKIAMWASDNSVIRDEVNPALFDLTAIPGDLNGNATKSLLAKNIAAVMCCLESQNRMAFVASNLTQLISYGLYEEALFNAYIGTKTNFNVWKLRDLKFMFNLADRDVLYKLGDDVEKKYPITVYRGICGDGDVYRPRGLSWTTDLEQAKWFATFPQERYKKKFNNIHVYKTQVSKKKTYFYTNGREESEVVCNITPNHKIELIWREDE